MILEQTVFENTDVAAATGLSAATIQTWANRGILMLSEEQRNPGPGQRRLYSALDIARIAVTQSLIGYGLAASSASRIAYRLEHGRTASEWRDALQEGAEHIYVVVVDDFDVARILTGSDQTRVAETLNVLSEDCKGGPLEGAIIIHTKTAVFDIGSSVRNALRLATSWHRVDIPSNDVAEISAKALMHGFARAFRSAECPTGAEVFRDQNDATDHVYYFSPTASAVAAKVLRQHSAVACSQPQDLAVLRKVTP